jgi:hypothetical protein
MGEEFKCCWCSNTTLTLDQENDCYRCEKCELEFCTTEQMNHRLKEISSEDVPPEFNKIFAEKSNDMFS